MSICVQKVQKQLVFTNIPSPNLKILLLMLSFSYQSMYIIGICKQFHGYKGR